MTSQRTPQIENTGAKTTVHIIYKINVEGNAVYPKCLKREAIMNDENNLSKEVQGCESLDNMRYHEWNQCGHGNDE